MRIEGANSSVSKNNIGAQNPIQDIEGKIPTEVKSINTGTVDSSNLKALGMATIVLNNSVQEKYELALSENELAEIINKLTLKIICNPEDAYNKLQEGDKHALKHLVKAAYVLDKVYLQQDHKDNISLKATLEQEAQNGNEHARKALVIFNIFNGIEGNNGLSPEPLRLFKNLELTPGKNVFPSDITKEELIEYLKNNIHKTAGILSNDTVVTRQESELVSIPYLIYFRKEYEAAAKELLLAADDTTHEAFANYLRLQAQALVSVDPEYSYKADVAWAALSDSPLEFTIARENYADELTGSVATDPELLKLLDKNKIAPKQKDFIGVRVGIDNREVSLKLAKYKEHLKALSELMPLKERYVQSVNLSKDIKQTLSDIHVVYFSGDYAALRPGLTLAQNLPNGDKLSVQLGQGQRNVFHKEIREGYDKKLLEKLLDKLVEPQYHSWYRNEAYSWFVILHELSHTLGPVKTESGKDKGTSLGSYGSIFEETKADLGSLVCSKYLKDIGEFTEEQLNQIYLTLAVNDLPLSRPTLDQTHKVGSLMQLNYFIENGAIKIENGDKLSIEPQKSGAVARQMLEEIISIQLEGNEAKAKTFVDKYSKWTDTMEYISQTKKSLSPKPLKILDMPLANRLLNE